MKHSLNFSLKAVIVTLQIVVLFSITFESKAQASVTSVTTGYFTADTGTTYTDSGLSGLSGNTYMYTYGSNSDTSNNDEYLTALTAGGVTYNFLPITSLTVKMRRVDNAVVQGTRELKFDEGVVKDSTAVTINSKYDDDMEHYFESNTSFNSGSDNIFTNQGDGNGNNNDIERVDVIIPHGLQAPDNSKIGLAIFERGNAGQHDPVKVAAILSVDASGNPTSYSSIISITSATYGATDPVAPKNFVIERRDVATSSHLLVSTYLTQAIGGVFIKYSDFGIPNGTIVYGYSLIPSDFKGTTPADILNYTDSTLYPTNTSANDGGIDLVSFTGTLQSGSYSLLPVSLTSFTAQVDNSTANLKWDVENATSLKECEVQKSLDGINFTTVAILWSLRSSPAQGMFTYSDDISSANANAVIYYRIKFMSEGESDFYSPVRQLIKKDEGNTTVGIVTYPNPVVNGFSVIIPATWQNKDLRYSLTSEDGRMIMLNTIKNSGSKFQVNVNGLARGVYVLRVSSGSNVLENKVIKQ